ncbi:GCN5 family acetyltransferase [Paenibacillus swuensis]|uniref:GCN5 family acetyltransferase n=1 Tax=Paenibacillus swuensis TaxID=1178515 RepID=A0A172TE85_9BACL|nr:N-acetyltransferase [Paenibacillus swuensis]ANE45351.1 GCN5 family acetyltransferase [Paenibacillus swuensis]
MNIVIRHERPEDYHLVEEITREAFWNLYGPGCNEHLIIHNLRRHADFIPELSFVIELDGKIAGSIFYSHSKVINNHGIEHKTITFGPVSILPALQRKGLGRALIVHSIEEAKKLGYTAIIIGGYPYHYKPYGFIGSKKYGIAMPDGNYYTGIMALPLYQGAFDSVSGTIFFSECMETDESQLEAFDKAFPEKEKAVQPSQAEFELAISEIDDSDYN